MSSHSTTNDEIHHSVKMSKYRIYGIFSNETNNPLFMIA